MLDINQAALFIKCLTGNADSVVTFQSFYDPKGEKSPANIAQVWHAKLTDSIDFINYKQSLLAGVYVCINGTDLKGREIYNINNLRVLFVDHDGMAEPSWRLPPHFTQKRDETHGHAFWRINAGDLTHDEWSILQKHLALYYGTDEQVVDPCRVARLAGTLHLKNPQQPAVYRITLDNSDTLPQYTPEQIRLAHPLTPEKDAILNQWAEARQGINSGVGYENSQQELEKFITFASVAAHPAVLGSGTHELYRVACFGHDHGISLDIAKETLWNHYNPRCIPPWTDDERHHFDGVIYRAYHYSKSAAGCKTARAGFLALPPLPEPNCGWENQAQQFNQPVSLTAEKLTVTAPVLVACEDSDFRFEHRMTYEAALNMAAQITLKSSPFTFAVVFDGVNYRGVNLIRCKDQFYEFNGVYWQQVDDSFIKSSIQRAFSAYSPPDALVSGVFRSLCDLVTVREASNGTWLSNRPDSVGNYTVFANGIADLTKPVVSLMKHTPEFFSLNALSHNYNPAAQCPNFLNFLTSIWDNDQQLKDQLQEFFGYCLTPDVSLQKFAVFVGKSRGGKGTIVTVLMNMIGKNNIAAPALDDLASNSMLGEMSTKAVALIPDAHSVDGGSKNKVLAKLKAITGADPVSFHELYKGGRNQVFTCKIIMSTNNVPDFNDPSGALVNRMLAFPFYKSFAGRENFQLAELLNSELEGITNWAIEGLRRLRRNGGRFTESKAGLAEKEEIRKDLFPLAEFVDSSCVLNVDEFTMLDDLYNAYRLWSSTQGVKMPMTKSVFDKTLRTSSLPISHDLTRGKGFRGITIKPAFAVNNVVPFQPVAI